MAQSLKSSEINDSLDAPSVFGAKGSGGLLVVRPGNNPLVPWCSVPEGFYALVTSSGAELLCGEEKSPVWPSGWFLSGPFTKISHLVTKQTVIFDAPVKGCKTADNVTVQIDVSVAFRIMGDENKGEDPKLVKIFVHQVTPAGLESQLKDALAEEIRTLARSLKHTQVYACRTGNTSGVPAVEPAAGRRTENDAESDDEDGSAPDRGVDVTLEMKKRLNNQFERQGVQISDVMIQDVKLPNDITTQMSNKSLVRSKQEYEMMEQRFEMQNITLTNEYNAKKVDYAEQQDKGQTEGSRDVQAVKDKLTERRAGGNRALKDYKEHTRAQTLTLQAETSEMVVNLDFDRKRELQKLNLEASEEANLIESDAAAKVKEITAEADLEVAKHNARGKIVVAEAESEADKLLKTQRDLEIIDRKLDVYESFVNNNSVIISGSEDADINKLLLTNTMMDGGIKNKSHEMLVAELNLMRLASNAYGLSNSSYIPEGKDVKIR